MTTWCTRCPDCGKWFVALHPFVNCPHEPNSGDVPLLRVFDPKAAQ